MDIQKRKQNEKKFTHWENLPGGGRIYWFEIAGKHGWKARYVKETNNKEELHIKYPIDKGHTKLK